MSKFKNWLRAFIFLLKHRNIKYVGDSHRPVRDLIWCASMEKCPIESTLFKCKDYVEHYDPSKYGGCIGCAFNFSNIDSSVFEDNYCTKKESRWKDWNDFCEYF